MSDVMEFSDFQIARLRFPLRRMRQLGLSTSAPVYNEPFHLQCQFRSRTLGTPYPTIVTFYTAPIELPLNFNDPEVLETYTPITDVSIPQLNPFMVGTSFVPANMFGSKVTVAFPFVGRVALLAKPIDVSWVDWNWRMGYLGIMDVNASRMPALTLELFSRGGHFHGNTTNFKFGLRNHGLVSSEPSTWEATQTPSYVAPNGQFIRGETIQIGEGEVPGINPSAVWSSSIALNRPASMLGDATLNSMGVSVRYGHPKEVNHVGGITVSYLF